MPKSRKSVAPKSGPTFETLQFPDCAGPFLSAEEVLSALQAAMVVKDIKTDAAGRPIWFDFEIELPRSEAPVDPSFDPWEPNLTAEVARALPPREIACWLRAQWIRRRRAAIERDGRLLLEVVGIMLDSGMRAPDWLAKAYRRRLDIFQTYETSSLDRAFGVAAINERDRKTLQADKQLRPKVHAAMLERLRADPDRPMDTALEEEVGRKFGIGKTKTGELYRAAVREDGATDQAAFKRILKFEAENTGETVNSPVLRKPQ